MGTVSKCRRHTEVLGMTAMPAPRPMAEVTISENLMLLLAEEGQTDLGHLPSCCKKHCVSAALETSRDIANLLIILWPSAAVDCCRRRRCMEMTKKR